MGHLFVAGDGSPLAKPEDVIPFLGRGAKHWRAGYSAYEAAYSWLDARDVPPAVRAVLETDPTFAGAVLLRACFEKKTRLDGLGRDSQTDVLAVLETRSGRAVLGVEAKVSESFGPVVAHWYDGSPGKRKRLEGLLQRLSVEHDAARYLRYQLIHRSVAALIEAEAENARDAAMVVQSFSPVRAGFSDFQAFAAALGAPVEKPGGLSRAVERDGVRLRLGWAVDRVRPAAGAE
jgi:hypothetical protein